MVRDAPRAIYELEHMGVPFSPTAEGKIAQRNFGGHTRDFGRKPVKRACYAADRTGRVVLDTLYDQCLRHQVKFYSEHHVLSLILEEGRCKGVVTYDLATGELHCLHSKAVLLATAGLGKIYKTTSNGFANTGDGFHLAYQLGIPLEDMEFIQFHPTGLYPLGILVCALTNWNGGWETGDLDIPAQGLLLDSVGCKYHWDRKGIPTDTSLKKLQELLDA